MQGPDRPQVAPFCLQGAEEHMQACPCLPLVRDHAGPSLLGIPSPGPWGSPKFALRSPGPYCSLWQPVALSILSVFLLVSRKQARGNVWRGCRHRVSTGGQSTFSRVLSLLTHQPPGPCCLPALARVSTFTGRLASSGKGSQGDIDLLCHFEP